MDSCKGCYSYDPTETSICLTTMRLYLVPGSPSSTALQMQEKSGKPCPCSTCIVKVMCVEACGDLNLFLGRVRS